MVPLHLCGRAVVLFFFVFCFLKETQKEKEKREEGKREVLKTPVIPLIGMASDPPRTSQLRLSQPEAGAVVCPAWGHGHTESHRE